MSAEIQHDLFGGESRKVHRKATFEKQSAKQLNLFGSLQCSADQMNLFADIGIPEELVWKQDEPAPNAQSLQGDGGQRSPENN